jgi:hypothetical protein
MPVQDTLTEVVTAGTSTTESLSQLFSVTGTSNPTYLIVDAIDRNEYTVSSTGATGDFSGNGATLDFSSIGGDGNGAGIVFTWQASTDQYVNATYGAFNQLDYTSSASPNDVTNISVFTTSNASLAQQDAGNAYALISADPSGYVGSITFANDPKFSGTVPAQATPDAIAAAALKFVGDAWNQDGCWVLASTIAAEAGAGLPVQSTDIGVPGHANGEWVVVYNGPVSASGAWQSLLTTGDVLVFGHPGGGGHITTCVSGSGSTAMLVDNIAYEDGSGRIINSANDGAAADLLISPPHPASQEWGGVSGSSSVVIYALDTPVVTDKSSAATVTTGGTLSLSNLFAVSDPANKSITKYQIYNTNSADTLLLSGKAQSGISAGAPLTVTSLAGLSLLATGSSTTDTLEIRAYNGAYWGDWQTLTVNVAAPPPQKPVLEAQTAAQTWTQGKAVSLTLPATLFKDPQGQTLTYSASGTAGAGLPSWLQFNPATLAFTGTVPAGMEKFAVTVTAKDTAGLSNTETFTVTVPAAAPVVAAQTAAQNWAESSTVSFALPSGTFTDPQGETLTYKASLASGAALPAWLKFSAVTETFAGTAPATAATLQLKVTATDSSGLSVFEEFTATIAKSTGQVVSAGDWHGGALTVTSAVTAEHGGLPEQGGTPTLSPGSETQHTLAAVGHGSVFG